MTKRRKHSILRVEWVCRVLKVNTIFLRIRANSPSYCFSTKKKSFNEMIVIQFNLKCPYLTKNEIGSSLLGPFL